MAIDWRVTPQISINDPELMVVCRRRFTAATGMDALTHAIEGLCFHHGESVDRCGGI